MKEDIERADVSTIRGAGYKSLNDVQSAARKSSPELVSTGKRQFTFDRRYGRGSCVPVPSQGVYRTQCYENIAEGDNGQGTQDGAHHGVV